MLKRIEVKNFKSLKHLDYKCAKLNLLTGLNGAGKSSFVQTLLLLRALEKHIEKECYEMPLREIVGDDEGATFKDLKYCYAKPGEEVKFAIEFDVEKKDCHDDSGIGRIERTIFPRGREGQVIHVCNPDYLKACKELDEVLDPSVMTSWEADEMSADECYERQEKMNRLEKELELRTEEAMKKEIPFASAYRSLWKNANMVSAFRGHPKQIHEGMPELTGGWNRGRTGVRFNPEGDDVGGYLAEYGMQTGLIESAGETNPLIFPGTEMHGSTIPDDDRKHTFLLEQVQLWLNIVSPGAKVSFEKVMVGNRKRYVQSVAYGDKKFKPENVGFGVSDILPVLTALLTSRPGGIVIIENPEAHLHPKGQAKMGELLARAAAYGVQLFVETHSDHVINGIRVAVADKLIQPDDVNIAFFERREHGVSRDDGSVGTETYAEVCNVKVDGKGALSEYPDGFMDEWGNQLLELL